MVDKGSEGKADEVKGKVKETAGHATGDDELKGKGRGDQAKGDVKQAGQKIKDAVTPDR
jgi:uncharacterized protein YjbJ (UPF0337 family)